MRMTFNFQLASKSCLQRRRDCESALGVSAEDPDESLSLDSADKDGSASGVGGHHSTGDSSAQSGAAKCFQMLQLPARGLHTGDCQAARVAADDDVVALRSYQTKCRHVTNAPKRLLHVQR